MKMFYVIIYFAFIKTSSGKDDAMAFVSSHLSLFHCKTDQFYEFGIKWLGGLAFCVCERSVCV